MLDDNVHDCTEAYPDKSADSVADFLYKTVCRLGCFDILISDQGREFINTIIDNLMTKLGTEHRVSSTYHPQTNGQRERDNRTLKNALSKLVNDRGDNWDVFIPGVLFAHHTSVHASTKMTPFECMYIRKAKLPMDIKDSPKPKEVVISDDFLQAMQNLRQNITSKVSNNITKPKKIQKEQHDKLHNSHHELGLRTSVYLKNSRQMNRIGAKLEPRFLGPYEVHQVLGKGRVKLKSLKSGQVLRNAYHGSNLKRHTPQDVFPTNHTSPASHSSYTRPTTRSTKTTSSTSPSCRTSHTSSKRSVSPTVPHHTRFMSSTSCTSPIKSKKPSTTTSNTPKRPHYSFQPMTIQRRRELSKQ
ncbi:uncharacterized protein LOC124131476 [Haliotis rufescens]|uniref:uncharacterized protein LOC124131476 n=1 Tax=Haliotis rufescens TaxID=6454 RepID=UPI00201FA56F|nr:uncharacterized protein LOC124131476 [Haliotis rufescens]